MQMGQYVRITKGLNDPGQLIKKEDLYEYPITSNKDWYVSTFYYNEDQLKEFKKKKSVAGITDVKTDYVYFDFDSKNNLDAAKKDALELISRLNKQNILSKNIEVFFSGNKGFTVGFRVNKLLKPSEVKYIAVNIFGHGLETLDTQIYNANRILRLPYTRHPDSGLYKIPLSVDQLNSLPVSEIKTLASNLENAPETRDIELTNFAVPEIKESPKVEQILDFDLTKVDFINKPPYLDKARWLIANGYFKNGERSNALLCLGATYKNVGYSKDHVYRFLKAAAELQSRRTGDDRFPDEELWVNIVEQVFGPGWKNGQYTTKDPASWLFDFAKKNNVLEEDKPTKPIRISDVESGFVDFVTHIDENTIKTGIHKLDTVMPLTIGMNLGIVGSASSGKTSIALEILKNTSQAGITSVFASLDMHRIRLFEKLLYKVSKGELTREEIYERYRNGEGTELTEMLKDDFENVWFYDRSCATVDNIRDYVLDVQNKTGEKVKLVMIDYFERVVSDMTDETAASKRIAGALQDLVNDLGICLIVLLQPNKMSLGGGPDTPIMSYTAIKGSSFLYQSFRNIISIWRPFFTPTTKHQDKYMQMAILKNDLGEVDVLDFRWTGKTGEIRELDDFEKNELEHLLQEKYEEREDGGWE